MRSHWGWGVEADAPDAAAQRKLARTLKEQLGWDSLLPTEAVAVEDLTLPEPKVALPATLATLASVDVRDRAQHTYGRSYRDVARAHAGRFDHPRMRWCAQPRRRRWPTCWTGPRRSMSP